MFTEKVLKAITIPDKVWEKMDEEDKMNFDEIQKPKHYADKSYGIECIEITENLDFCSGNAFKYAWRFEDKSTPLKDLNKCLFYVRKCREKGFFKREDVDLVSKMLIVKEKDKYGSLLYDIYSGFFVSAEKKLIELIDEVGNDKK